MAAARFLTAALVEAGRIGCRLERDPLRGKPCTHAGALESTGQVRLVAAVDPDPERLAEFGRDWGVGLLYRSHLDLLEKERVDILAVASHTHTHAQIVVDAAASGKVRGIYCEKPIALTLEDADRMVEACERAGVALVIGHERRFGAHFFRARELVGSGELGEIRSVLGQALSGEPPALPRDQFGGGPLFHDGTHLTDLMNYFCGPVEWVIGKTGRAHGPQNVEHTASGLIGFESGATGFIEGGGRREYFAFELEIQGSRGVLRVGNRQPELWLARPSGRLSGFAELERAEFPDYTPNNGFTAAFEGLIRQLESGEPSLSTGRDGRAALAVILALYQSATRGGRRVRLQPDTA